MSIKRAEKSDIPPAINSSGWEIPEHTEHVMTARTHRHCLVIPVINEGQRLTALFGRLQEMNIGNALDVIIADGGSTDGSTQNLTDDFPFVRGVLRLHRPEGLSAQLRCAYSFALLQGYEGVVTIDGNNKDDPEALPRFVAALDSGYDFVQGSRYVAGGHAENTPLVRTLAIRYIHAPLCSTFSGFHWTDTTQGFRAYSRRLLLHEGIQPFRSVFRRYELLAFLSVRAPRLELKCLEIGTTRRYPKGAKAPTKISKITGNWSVFATLVRACVGSYNEAGFGSGQADKQRSTS